MTTKKCSCCKCTLLIETYFEKNRKGEYYKTCNGCRARQRVQNTKRKDKVKQWREDNKEALAQKAKEYREANKEVITQREKQWREDNKEGIAQKKKKYREANKEVINQKHKQYLKDKRHHCEHKREKQICKHCNPKGHLKSIVTSRVRKALKSNKKNKSLEYLGCDIETYKAHIEKQFKEGMTWDNFGEWHIDHIKPIMYKENGQEPTIEQVAERLHYTNTQPLWAKENMEKGNRFIG